jgi:hypothetical protein
MGAAAKFTVRLAILALGVLLAVAITSGVGAADTTTTASTTTTTETTPTTTETTAETTTEPATNGTTTVEVTTTRFVPVEATTSSDSGSSTPAWVWVLLGILAVALVIVIVLLGRRGGGGGSSAMSLQDRHRQLDATVGTWAAQGWALETQTDDSAVLRRGTESMHVTVDQAGHVSTRPLP